MASYLQKCLDLFQFNFYFQNCHHQRLNSRNTSSMPERQAIPVANGGSVARVIRLLRTLLGIGAYLW